MSVFDLFRVSLIESEQPDLLSERQLTRGDFLNKIFSEQFYFIHQSMELFYKPLQEQPDAHGVIVGAIGKKTSVLENAPPENDFAETEREQWKVSFLVIDTKHHQDGQKISILNKIGKNQAILTSLAKYVNNSLKSKYHIEIAPIIDEQSFWKFANANKGQITNISFTFIAPNMFGSIDDISKVMKKFKDIENAQKIKIELSSDDAINTDTQKIKESVEYISKGAGQIEAKTKNKKFNSNKKTKHVKLPDDKQDRTLAIQILHNLSKILDRDESDN